MPPFVVAAIKRQTTGRCSWALVWTRPAFGMSPRLGQWRARNAGERIELRMEACRKHSVTAWAMSSDNACDIECTTACGASLAISVAKSCCGRHVRRTEIRKLGKQILMRTHTIALHFPVGEDGEELIKYIVCERSPVVGI